MILTVTRALCTGSRDLKSEADRLMIWQTLDDLHLEVRAMLHILVGDEPKGADHWVRMWARNRRAQGWSVDHEAFAADWSRYGKKAGPIRNGEMVATGAQLALAWFLPVPPGADPLSVNKGTRGCVKLAKAAGIPVREYGLETRATPEHEQETLPL